MGEEGKEKRKAVREGKKRLQEGKEGRRYGKAEGKTRRKMCLCVLAKPEAGFRIRKNFFYRSLS
jgi:hypothetical protein